jgi:hypothetical protein
MNATEERLEGSSTRYRIDGLRWRITVEHHPGNTRAARWVAKVYQCRDEQWCPTMGVFRPTKDEAEGEAARYLLRKAALDKEARDAAHD